MAKADALSDDDFVQEDSELGDDFEGGVELAYRDHQARPQQVYHDVRATLLDTRPSSGMSASLARPDSGALRRPDSAASLGLSAGPSGLSGGLSTGRSLERGGSARPSSALPSPHKALDTAGWPSQGTSPLPQPAKKPKTSQYYLKQHRLKAASQKHQHAAERHQRQRDFQYGALEKMAEMNEWCVALGMPTRYRLVRKEEEGQEVLKCHVFEDEVFDRELGLEAMLKRHKGMKQRISSMPERPRGSKEEDAQRQEALRAALLHTIQVTNKLKEQLALLDRRSGLSPFVVE